MEYQDKDVSWMRQALLLAQQGQYTARPNPCVGAVLVKDDHLIASGWHQCTGEAHAEVHALQQAGDAAKGATCYVTLEPCAHYGHTPPCCQALVQAGISKVVVAMRDPHLKTNGAGIRYLQENGIEVIVGILAEEAQDLNRGFLKRVLRHKPWVTLKLAMTLDGKIADFSNHSQWITGVHARSDVQTLRARHAAIMSTATTIIADNARLTMREWPADFPEACRDKFKPPLRVILDRQFKLTPQHTIFQEPGDILTYTRKKVSDQANVIYLSGAMEDPLPLSVILEDLATKQINSVLIEAGGHFAGKILQSDLVDEWVIYIAAKILGQQGQSAFYLDKALKLSESFAFKFKTVALCGDDIKIEAVRA